jgi:hypothetical protein
MGGRKECWRDLCCCTPRRRQKNNALASFVLDRLPRESKNTCSRDFTDAQVDVELAPKSINVILGFSV